MSELYHEGVKGQRWGVRHGPPYPLNQNRKSLGSLPVKSRDGLSKRELKKIKKQSAKALKQVDKKGTRSQYYRDKHTIPKGTTFYRSVETDRDIQNGGKLGDGPTYVSYIDVDRKHYHGFMVKGKDKTATEYKLNLKEDLTVPSRNELKEVVLDVVKKNPKLKKDIVNGMFDYFMPKDRDQIERVELLTAFQFQTANEKAKWKDYVDSVVKNTFNDKSVNEAFLMTAKSFVARPKVKEMVIKELKSRGYNAMTDEAGVTNGEGVDPLIVFDSKVFDVVGKQKIDYAQASKSSLDYNQYRTKKYRAEKKNYDWFEDW